MTLSRWLVLVGVATGLGFVAAVQRIEVVMKGYGVGARLQDVHAQSNDVAWLDTQVLALRSPRHLAAVADDHRMKFVAWQLASDVKRDGASDE